MKSISVVLRALCLASAVALAVTPSVGAQPAKTYAPPVSLGEAAEIALALTAAPAEISGAADVYVLRGTEFVKAQSGTNGCACMVGRDQHVESRYPICFDREGARTTLFREIMEGTMRAKGVSEAAIQPAVAAAYEKGTLRMPAKPSIAYMMSPKQVLFSSANSDGVHVGAWWPHLMLMMPHLTPDDLGLTNDSKVDVISIEHKRGSHTELVIKVAKWSDGQPATVAAKR